MTLFCPVAFGCRRAIFIDRSQAQRTELLAIRYSKRMDEVDELKELRRALITAGLAFRQLFLNVARPKCETLGGCNNRAGRAMFRQRTDFHDAQLYQSRLEKAQI